MELASYDFEMYEVLAGNPICEKTMSPYLE
jgi:hypothetical protein